MKIKAKQLRNYEKWWMYSPDEIVRGCDMCNEPVRLAECTVEEGEGECLEVCRMHYQKLMLEVRRG